MFKRVLTTATIIVGLLALSMAAQAHGSAEVRVLGAWARATTASEMMPMGDMATEEAMAMGEMPPDQAMPMRGGVSAAYMVIENAGDHPVRLVSAMTPAAGVVEIHETRMEGDIMRMRPVEGGIDIPAGESASLEPGGYHVMLLDLTRDLVAGEALALTLTFENLHDDGTPMDESFSKVVGVLVADEAPVTGDLMAMEAWARPAAADGVSAAYMQLVNTGAAADRLVSATTDAAGVVEIHETQMEGDIMRMRPVEGGIDIPPGEMVSLEPGGYHVMLMELPGDLIMGDALTLTLTFESGAAVQVAVPVYDAAMGGGMDMEHGNS